MIKKYKIEKEVNKFIYQLYVYYFNINKKTSGL